MPRRLAALLLAAALAGGSASAQPAPTPAELIARYEGALTQVDDPSVRWLLAEAYAQADQKGKALAALAQVADRRMDFYPPPDAALNRYRGDPTYEALLARMARERRDVRRSQVAFTLPGLLPEGVAYDADTRRLFIGDALTDQVFVTGESGATRRFAGPLDLSPLGMTVDRARGRLWVATTNAFSDAADKRGEIVGLDLSTGETVERLGPAGLTSVNDLTVAPDGDLWATDTLAGAVVRFRGAKGPAERITPDGGMAYPNGIAVSDDGRHVFVAQGASLRRIDAETGAVLRLPHPPDLTTLGIDGLYWIEGALVGVQNGGTAGRVIRLELTPARDAIARWSVLEGGGPAFDTPTTGAPAPGRLYVLANSQIQLLRPDGTVAEPAKLKPILILETPLSGA